MRSTHRPILGTIESLVRDGDTLLVLGWWLWHEPHLRIGLEVEIDGTRVEVIEERHGIESADLAALHPHLSLARNARFGLRVRPCTLRSGSLVRVRPVLECEAPATALSALYDSPLPHPNAQQAKIIGGDYERVGMEFLSFFLDLCRLPKDGRVLDAGCGFGRMARAIASYVDDRARYVGFDVMKDAIDFCRRAVGGPFPHFRFEHVDVDNGMYNVGGQQTGSAVRFPCEDSFAHLVVMTSVITHLVPEDTAHYLVETARVLRPDGIALVTAFCIDEESRDAAQDGQNRANLKWSESLGYWIRDDDVKENVLGYDHARLAGWIRDAGLRVVARHRGAWSGVRPALSFQDLFLLARA
jgi:SAM-dependent methyltransferase